MGPCGGSVDAYILRCVAAKLLCSALASCPCPHAARVRSPAPTARPPAAAQPPSSPSPPSHLLCSPSCCRSDYPLMPEGARPLERFVAAANSLGELLDGDQQEALMQVGAVQGCRLPAGVGGCTFGGQWGCQCRQARRGAAGPAHCCRLLQLHWQINRAECSLNHAEAHKPALALAPNLQELPKAMTKASTLLVPLAREA